MDNVFWPAVAMSDQFVKGLKLIDPQFGPVSCVVA
jgi:hypothetical protein